MSGDQKKQSPDNTGDVDKVNDELDDQDVPLLQDIVKVENPVQVGKTPKTKLKASDQEDDSILNDSTIWALLGDEWKETSDEAIEKVQTAVNQNKELWKNKDTQALNKALKVKIDSTLHAWLQETVNTNIDSLRKTLLDALTEEIDKRLSEIDTHHEG